MKPSIIGALVVIALSSLTARAQTPTESPPSGVRSVVDRFKASEKSSNGVDRAALFTDDALVFNASDERHFGRADVDAFWKSLFTSGTFNTSVITERSTEYHKIGPNLWLADYIETLTGQHTPHGRAMADRLIHMTLILRRETGDDWRISYFRAGDTRGFPPPPTLSAAVIGDRQAILGARAAQNAAMLSGNLDSVASFWTEDVTIRRGLGIPQSGRAEYRKIMEVSGNADSAILYQREPSEVEVGGAWPLAFETGTWKGFLKSDPQHPTITGRYSAQWVKRGRRWLIRSEVFVALECAGSGCASKALP